MAREPLSWQEEPGVDINVRKQAEVQVIQLRGVLRLGDGVEAFRKTVDEALAAGNIRLALNLAEVPMVDSSGIGVLVKAMASAKQRGGALKLVNPSKFAVQTLRLVGVLGLFEVFDTEDKAVESFS
jgi:anti-sigma B factor antagonist